MGQRVSVPNGDDGAGTRFLGVRAALPQAPHGAASPSDVGVTDAARDTWGCSRRSVGPVCAECSPSEASVQSLGQDEGRPTVGRARGGGFLNCW